MVKNPPAVQETRVRPLGWDDALGKETATYSSILASGFSGGSDAKESACNVEDLSSIPGLGRCPGEGNGYPLQYSCLENSMDRGVWQATVHGVPKSQDTTERLSLQTLLN